MVGHKRTILLAAGVFLALAAVSSAWAGDKTGNGNLYPVALLQKYLRVDTINPPGNESRAVDFFASILEAEGIAYESAESAPGRGNIWARLKGGAAPALILINHTDVVPADPEHWTDPPLSGLIRDGYIFGRGALDMKSGGIAELLAFVALHRDPRPLVRDVLFVATADEEAGGLFGAGWLVKHRPELFANAGMLINEGGGGALVDGRKIFSIEVTQKTPLWLRLIATDAPSHGSTPHATSAVGRLLDALDRIRNHEFAPRIIAPVDIYFKAMAEVAEGADRTAFSDMATAVGDPAFLKRLQGISPFRHALTRDTCAITRLAASPKINVVAPRASAELDCRLLPDRGSARFVGELEALIAGTGVEIEQIMAFTPAISPTGTPLYEAIRRVISRHYPDAVVVPGVATGFTDSHFFRDLGIASYGFMPVLLTDDDHRRVHGNDERISTENMRRAADHLLEIVDQVVHE